MAEPHRNPIPPLKAKSIRTFWSHVTVKGPEECWEWNGSITNKGYGRFLIRRNKKCSSYGAHRLSWFFQHREDPMDKSVLHKCDNPKCCNPNHLFLGDQKANIQDMIQKGRRAPGLRPITETGTAHWNNKLTEQQVQEIRLCCRNRTFTHADLAAQYEVSIALIDAISSGRLWKQLEQPPDDPNFPKNTRRLANQGRPKKLTDAQVLEIRKRAQTETYARLAANYGVSISLISGIVNGHFRTNVKPPEAPSQNP